MGESRVVQYNIVGKRIIIININLLVKNIPAKRSKDIYIVAQQKIWGQVRKKNIMIWWGYI